MSDDTSDGLDLMVMQHFAPRRSSTLAGRREAEKKPMAASDRIALKTTGRTVQMNLKVRAAWKAEVATYANATGRLNIEMLELAWEFWKAHHPKPEGVE